MKILKLCRIPLILSPVFFRIPEITVSFKESDFESIEDIQTPGTTVLSALSENDCQQCFEACG
jgi:hypothetical protein